MQKDPVCGMIVDEKKTQLKSELNGRTFYFCSVRCKATFERNPSRFVR